MNCDLVPLNYLADRNLSESKDFKTFHFIFIGCSFRRRFFVEELKSSKEGSWTKSSNWRTQIEAFERTNLKEEFERKTHRKRIVRIWSLKLEKRNSKEIRTSVFHHRNLREYLKLPEDRGEDSEKDSEFAARANNSRQAACQTKWPAFSGGAHFKLEHCFSLQQTSELRLPIWTRERQ